MGLETVFFLGAFLLLAAMIYGTLSWHTRDRAAVRAAEEITRKRYPGREVCRGLAGGPRAARHRTR